MKKTIEYALLCIMAACVWIAVASAGERYEIYPTLPGSSVRDYGEPGMIYEEDSWGRTHASPTLPGSSARDFSKPGMIYEEDSQGQIHVYPTLPGSSARDFSKPGYVIEEK